MPPTKLNLLKWAGCGFLVGLTYFAATADYGRIDADASRRAYHAYVVFAEIIGGAVGTGIFGIIYAILANWSKQRK
jgi:hypothetical protein